MSAEYISDIVTDYRLVEPIEKCASILRLGGLEAFDSPEYKKALAGLYATWHGILSDEQIRMLNIAIFHSFDRLKYSNITPEILSTCHTVEEFENVIYDAREIGPRERVPDDEEPSR